MTDRLKCPFCGSELEQCFENMPDLACSNIECDYATIPLPPKIWQALIQTKQDLEMAKSYVKGISEMVINSGDNIYIVIGHFKKLAEQTLKQIEHKEEK